VRSPRLSFGRVPTPCAAVGVFRGSSLGESVPLCRVVGRAVVGVIVGTFYFTIYFLTWNQLLRLTMRCLFPALHSPSPSFAVLHKHAKIKANRSMHPSPKPSLETDRYIRFDDDKSMTEDDRACGDKPDGVEIRPPRRRFSCCFKTTRPLDTEREGTAGDDWHQCSSND